MSFLFSTAATAFRKWKTLTAKFSIVLALLYKASITQEIKNKQRFPILVVLNY